MRRQVVLILLLVMSLWVITTAVWAQTQPVPANQPEVVIDKPPSQMVDLHAAWEPILLEPLDGEPGFLAPQVGSASDSCSTAPALFASGNSDGGLTTVNSMTTAPDDPSLQSCVWGLPNSDQGYRTVWYKFVAPSNGVVVIQTFASSYDTILAIHQGSCGELTLITCNDDTRGFGSEVRLAVRRSESYYVEMADWQPGVSGAAQLQVGAFIEPIDSSWDVVPPTSGLPGSLTRHAAVTDGQRYIYVVGGQTTLGATPILSNRLMRLDTATGSWTELAPMPGVGLSNTSAAFINGRLYVPGGYNGNNTTFDGTHWVYDTATNGWSKDIATIGSGPGWPQDVPFAWATAVVDGSNYHLLGGLDTQTTITPTVNTFYTYATSTNTWRLQTPLNRPRYAHTAAKIGNEICVVGGLVRNEKQEDKLISDGECWSNTSGEWRSIASLNYPRYEADSAVGADGRWYVFGGLDGSGHEVSAIELYNDTFDRWEVLNISQDLGARADTPARAWPRGEFVGKTLWVVGGHFFDPRLGNRALSLVERITLFSPPERLALPFIGKQRRYSDDTFQGAVPIGLNLPQEPIFESRTDFYDNFTFHLDNPRTVAIRLRNVPHGSDYDLYVYDANKQLWGKSEKPFLGAAEDVVINNLRSGNYFVVVVRTFPTDEAERNRYWLVVES